MNNNTTAEQPLVELSNAAILYHDSKNRNPVLRDVNLRVMPSQMIYLVGRVGSGKSSLLRTLYGDIPLRAGSGHVCGINLRGMSTSTIPKLRRRLGVIFQDYNLLQDFTVYQNLEFVMRATGHSNPRSIDKRIFEVTQAVDLLDKLDSYPMHISGGQRQRACIARALLNSPRLIIADEPTGNLDPVSSYEIMSLLNELTTTQNCAVIMSTHNSENLNNFPNQTYLCQNGQLIEALL